MAHFEVGKNVICIKTHSMGVVKKGQVFELLGIRKEYCGCVSLNVGISTELDGLCAGEPVLTVTNCGIHGEVGPSGFCDGIWWLHHSLFAPWDTTPSETTVDELLESLEPQTA